jgi:hypothetical protein
LYKLLCVSFQHFMMRLLHFMWIVLTILFSPALSSALLI